MIDRTIGFWGHELRGFALLSVTLVFAYVLNNFLIHVAGAHRLLDGGVTVIVIYLVALGLGGLETGLFSGQSLGQTAHNLSGFNAYVVRGAFWAVFLVGLVNASISFLRIENFAETLLGENLASSMNKQNFRGPYIHIPLVALGFVIAAFTRGLGFIWLTLLVVFSQLFIVITVNVYSYEQAFQADLVRFWYAALFLFATAHTLLAGGHVRVDVVFANLSEFHKKRVNFWGALLLGLPLAWISLVIGTWDQSRIINSPILRYEIGQQSVGGLYIKYLMAGFLLILAVTLVIEFVALMLASADRSSAADRNAEPDQRSKAQTPDIDQKSSEEEMI